MTDLRTFAAWKRQLRRDFPASERVSVRLVLPEKLPTGVHGNCQWMGTQFVIRLANNLNTNETWNELTHEWCHALRDHLPAMPRDSDHDEVFDVILGRIRRHYLGEV